MSHPRRTRSDGASAAAALTVRTNMAKGASFSSPSSPSSAESEGPVTPRSLARAHSNLDDVIDARRRRAELAVDDIGKILAGVKLDADVSPSSCLPVPATFLGEPYVVAEADESLWLDGYGPKAPRSRRHRDSDSGLGSSLKSSARDLLRPASPSACEPHGLPGLSSRARNRIYEHVLGPLLEEDAFKEYHPLVLECPRRIRDKEIACLRDLERILLGSAIENAKSLSLMRDFCLESIRCVQATVEYLNEQEQSRPSDHPYSGGYFIELVDQIHRYAQQIADAHKMEGEQADKMDIDITDEVRLVGDLTKTGLPSELVRVKPDGTAFSLATGLKVDLDAADSRPRFKRPLSEQRDDDEEIMRSMARRKKNAAELAPKRCSQPGCAKEFKRPCDLTKHEKTHSRPWKCPVPMCKYHEFGWPTEKERDRHHNDKHESRPAMYECWYKPCPYKSKRESNCKQHMEKAHGWNYVRTKTTAGVGGKKSSKPSSVAYSTPNMTTPASDLSIGLATPPEQHNDLAWMGNDELQRLLSESSAYPRFAQELVMGTPPVDCSPLDYGTPSTDAGYENYAPYQGQQHQASLPPQDDIYNAHARVPAPSPAAFPREILMQQQGYHDVAAVMVSMMPGSIPSTQASHLASLPASLLAQAAVCTAAPAPPKLTTTAQPNATLFTPKSMSDGEEFGDISDFETSRTYEDMRNQSKPIAADLSVYPVSQSQPADPLFGSQLASHQLNASFSQQPAHMSSFYGHDEVSQASQMRTLAVSMAPSAALGSSAIMRNQPYPYRMS